MTHGTQDGVKCPKRSSGQILLIVWMKRFTMTCQNCKTHLDVVELETKVG